LRLIALILLVATLGATDASAHRSDRQRDMSGIPIPSISHGEMAIIDRHRADVFALAARAQGPDPAFLTLVRYGELQFADCLWGLMPVSISDEESPFNECSHAYLAATKEILFRMRTMPGLEREAGEIVSRISYEAALDGAAFVGCIYSGEGFNTADLVRPHWHDVPFHLPSLLALGAAFGFLPLTAFLGSRLSSRMQGEMAQSQS
jgi:hypothetical protein